MKHIGGKKKHVIKHKPIRKKKSGTHGAKQKSKQKPKSKQKSTQKYVKKNSNVSNIFKYGYSFEKKSIERIKAIIKYTEKFGIVKAINQMSSIISHFIYDNRIAKIVITDLKNLRNWFIKIDKIDKKGGAVNTNPTKDVKRSAIVERITSLTEKLSKKMKGVQNTLEQTQRKLSNKMQRVVSKTMSRKNTLAKKVDSLGQSITSTIKKGIGQKQNTNSKPKNTNSKPKNTNGKPKNTNGNNYTNDKCKLCMKYCTTNGKLKKQNNNQNNQKKKKNNSPLMKVLNQGMHAVK
jgi:hypothetical protein